MFDLNFLSIAFIIFLENILLRFIVKHKLRQGTYLNMFYIIYYIFQGILSCVILFLDKDFLLANSSSNISIPIKISILPYCIGTLVAIWGILIGMIISNKIYRNRQEISWSGRTLVLCNNYSIDKFSFFLAIGFCFSILATLMPSYIVSALSLTFAFSPLLIGIWWNYLRQPTKMVWKVVIFITFLFHMLQGSRGLAVFPLAAFAVGYLFGLSDNKAKLKKAIRIFVIIGIISIPFLGFVQNYRENFGRGNEISMDTFTEMVNFASMDKNSDKKEDIYASYGRLLNHTNNVVVVMTPSVVPYRMFEAMDQEIASIFQVLGADNSQTFRENRADMGYSTGVATRYGFRVTETTSVEFGMFADSYSRFGYLGVFIYSILFAIVLALMEKWCYNHIFRSPLLAMVLISFLLYNGALNYMYSYYSFFKIVLIRGIMVIVCTKFFSSICMKNRI